MNPYIVPACIFLISTLLFAYRCLILREQMDLLQDELAAADARAALERQRINMLCYSKDNYKAAALILEAELTRLERLHRARFWRAWKRNRRRSYRWLQLPVVVRGRGV